MGAALGTALVLIAVAVLVYPFLRRERYSLPADPVAERLRAARLRVYRQIADLEADRLAGEITEQDYGRQLHEHRLAAARIIQQEAAMGVTLTDEEQLEREVQAARASRSGPPEGGDTV